MLFVPYFNTVLLAEVARRLAAAHADPVPREGDEADRVPEHRYPLNKHAQNNNAHPSVVGDLLVEDHEEGEEDRDEVVMIIVTIVVVTIVLATTVLKTIVLVIIVPVTRDGVTIDLMMITVLVTIDQKTTAIYIQSSATVVFWGSIIWLKISSLNCGFIVLKMEKMNEL